METKMKKGERISQSITLKAAVVAILSLLLLIPGMMVQNLIEERQYRSVETIEKINAKWSRAQTLCAPILSVPFTIWYKTADDKITEEHHTLHITPETLDIDAKLYPEEKHYGIYKTILYKSTVDISGTFEIKRWAQTDNRVFHWEEARIRLGFSDLRGITSHISFKLDDRLYEAEASRIYEEYAGRELWVVPGDSRLDTWEKTQTFRCTLNLNGSTGLSFIPLGGTTRVHIAGAWNAPGYTGNFSPETTPSDGFDATWNILRYNRSIPDSWVDQGLDNFYDSTFGVSLVNTVDHYQQNMRSAKYAFMFIALTYVVFFFIELLTKKRIHPIQYLLVGIALILFYSLLLSISEQLNFGWAYLIASLATIGLITAYTHSILKNKPQTALLAATLCLLYIFLYIVLQLEDIALLIGSAGLFSIVGLIMYFSRKISWYRQEEFCETEE
ncbi:MAG: cell envelope integrity protein CreD [Tannerellaceae bacterium]|jgi:inner membrane protein|nr:cell envelope integrity protein CreD [Tannerellaceae bacterium]